ncbi:MAG: tripartite tricarboxylate transporter substrate binding protein [Burkholderiales bacterium]|nr:tripartite tricarboxylate transporter substrate binding protein [Burkholderiales bacterium]
MQVSTLPKASIRDALSFTLAVAACTCPLVAGNAVAQAGWPSAKPITLIVPFGTGGNLDVTARLIGQKLAERLRQSVVVENVVGAGGVIGMERAARAAPDGYTLVLGADSPAVITAFVNPTVVKYDIRKDFAPVTLATTAAMVIVAKPELAAVNLADMIKLARASPGKLSYATSGVGSVLHLSMELIKNQSKTFIVHVPYRGGGQIVTDVIGNQIDLAMVVSVTATPHVLGKRLKGIAVTIAKRLPALPDIPAVSETAGFKDFNVLAWTGLFAPARTPQPVLECLNRELVEVLRAEEVRNKLAEGGASAAGGAAADFAQLIESDLKRYGAIAKAANIRE